MAELFSADNQPTATNPAETGSPTLERLERLNESVNILPFVASKRYLDEHPTIQTQYAIIKYLAKGGFGKIYLAEDSTNKEKVAVKIIHMTREQCSRQLSSRQMNEVASLAACSSPYIIQLKCAIVPDGFEAGQQQQQQPSTAEGHSASVEQAKDRDTSRSENAKDLCMIIVTEHCQLGDLRQQVRGRTNPFTEEEVLIIFSQLVKAIFHLHCERNILHRDITLANIFAVDTTGKIKLGDFGLCKHAENLNAVTAVADTICGTPAYFSPELWKLEKYGGKSDMWALGVVLYQLMTLKHPFGSGLSDSQPIATAELREKVIEGHYVEPAGYSEQLLGVLRSLLQKDPKERAGVRDLTENVFVKKAIEVMEARFAHKPQPVPAVVAFPLSDIVLYREHNEEGIAPKLHRKLLTVDDTGVTLSAETSPDARPARFRWEEVMLATTVRYVVASTSKGAVEQEFLRLYIQEEEFLESAYDVLLRADRLNVYLTAINTKIAQRANQSELSHDTPLS
jgi:serine/threonine protein kinase